MTSPFSQTYLSAASGYNPVAARLYLGFAAENAQHAGIRVETVNPHTVELCLGFANLDSDPVVLRGFHHLH